MDSTLALVKPHAFPRADEILSAITSAGFTITAKDVLSLNTTRAAAFYAAHPPPAGAGASSPPVPVADLIGALTAGPVMALVVSKAGGGVSDELASLAGPEDPATARTAAPGSLRARFGVDAAKNAVHVVATGADAEAQVAFFFPERERELPSGAAAKEYLMGSVVPSLTKGLTELCRVAPADPLGWLSTFLGDAAREARGGDASADAEAEAAKGAEANGEAKKDKQKIVFVLGGPGSGKVRLEARLWIVGVAMRGRGASRCDSERQLLECGSSRIQLATEACLWLTRVALGKDGVGSHVVPLLTRWYAFLFVTCTAYLYALSISVIGIFRLPALALYGLTSISIVLLASFFTNVPPFTGHSMRAAGGGLSL